MRSTVSLSAWMISELVGASAVMRTPSPSSATALACADDGRYAFLFTAPPLPITGAVGSPNVFINGRPAIIECTEGTPILSPNVFVNGRPKVLGCKK